MLFSRRVCLLLLGLSSLTAMAPAPPVPPAANAIRFVHDPCIARDGDYYYVYATGPGIPIRRSRDLVHWEQAGQVFKERVPTWATRDIPGASSLWAPDISYFGGRYRLYYSVSTFGSNRSAIGMAWSKTLDPSRPDYKWTDEGKVFESFKTSNFNAIDPNIALRPSGEPVLSFGSFWSGIKLVHLNPFTGKPEPNASVTALAQRPAPDALEAPFIVPRGEWYYLIVSFDFCCRGTKSTYNLRVGRSKTIEGPYVDKDGTPLLAGGGTPLLATQGNVIGPGHCAVLRDKKQDYLVHHYYDGAANGVPTLQVRPLSWNADGWPSTGSPLISPTVP